MRSRFLLATVAAVALVALSERRAKADIYELQGTFSDFVQNDLTGVTDVLKNGSFSGTYTMSLTNGLPPIFIPGSDVHINFYDSTGALVTSTIGGDTFIDTNYLSTGYVSFLIQTPTLIASFDFGTSFDGNATNIQNGPIATGVSLYQFGFDIDNPQDFIWFNTATSTFLSVPEPSTFALMAVGGAIGIAGRRKIRSAVGKPSARP
jgi:hypothetical protein